MKAGSAKLDRRQTTYFRGKLLVLGRPAEIFLSNHIFFITENKFYLCIARRKLKIITTEKKKFQLVTPEFERGIGRMIFVHRD